MELGKLRRGELIAAAGGLLLLIALFFLNWYSRQAIILLSGQNSVGVKAWDDLGFFGAIANLIILAAALSAVGLAVVTATSRTITLPVAASAMTAALGIAAVVMVLLRMLFQPGPNAFTDLSFGIWVALMGAGIVAYGGWISMREEGTTFGAAREQLESRYKRRPVPDRSATSEPRAAPEPGAAAEPEPFAENEPPSRPPPHA